MPQNDGSGSEPPGTHRRRFLAALGVGVTAGVAGCNVSLGDDEGGDGDDGGSLGGGDGNDGSDGGDGGSSDGADGAGNGDGSGATTGTPAGQPVDAGEKRESAGWPRFRYDRWNTGHKTGADVPGGGVTVKWDRTIGYVTNTPIVADGTVYVTESQTGGVRAFDAETGAESWVYDTGGEIPSNPSCVALDDDTVYVGAETGVHAIGRASGEKRWRFETHDYATTPVVVDGRIYVNSSDFLFAIAPDGTRQWYTRTGARRNRQPPTVVGDRLYQVAESSLFAIVPATGETLWSRELDALGTPTMSPVFRDGLLYVAASLKVHAYDPSRRGELVWSTERLDQNVHGTPSVAHDTVYAAVALVDLQAFDAANGEQRWQREIVTSGRPSVAGDTVLCFDRDTKSVRALDAQDGSDRWAHSLGFKSNATPTVVDDVVYVSGTDPDTGAGRVVALEER